MPFSDKFWIERLEKAGLLSPKRDGIVKEAAQAAGSTALQVGRGIGSTIEEVTGEPAIRQYFQEKEAAKPHWRPDPNYSPSSLHPADVARTVSTGVTQSALSLGAGVVGGAVGGAPGAIAATTAGMFAHTYGDRVKEYREAMPDADDGVIKGWAFLSSLGEALIETVAGPEQMVAGAFKGSVRQALNQTTRKLIKMIGKEAAKAAIAEGSEEVCQMYWDNVVRLAAGQNVELQPFSEVRDTFMGGALPGAFMGGVGAGVKQSFRRMDSQGQFVNEKYKDIPSGGPIDPRQHLDPALQVVQGLSEQLKVPIRFMTEAEIQQNAKTDENGNPVSVNGYYDTGKSEIVLNPNGELSIEQAFGHELKHFLNVHHPDLVEAFDSMAQQNLTEKGQQELADTGALYGEVGNATEEFNADWFARLAMEPDALREAAIIAENQKVGFGEKLINAITEFLKMVMDTARKIGTPEMEAVFNNAKEVRAEAIKLLSDFNRRQHSQLVKVEQAPAEVKQLPGRPERKLLPAGKPADERTEEEQARQKKLLEEAQTRSELEQLLKERQERRKVREDFLKHQEAMRKIDRHLKRFGKFADEAMNDEVFRRANTEELNRIEDAIRKGNPQLVRKGLDRLSKRVRNWNKKNRRKTESVTEAPEKSAAQPVQSIVPAKKLPFVAPEPEKPAPPPAPKAEERRLSVVPEKKLPFVAPEPKEESAPQSPDGIERVNTSDVHVDPKRFQFKSGTNPVTGVDESNKVGGEWDPKSAGLLYIWEDKTGKKFVVNGHHRLQLAKELGVPTLNAIVEREVDGVTEAEARRQGVLTNIRDGQGRVEDYATFVREDKRMDEAAAHREGIMSRSPGRQGFIIGRYAGEELYAAFKAGDITGAKAAAIAEGGKNDPAVQVAGMKKAGDMSAEQLREFLKILQLQQREQKLEQLDLFGFDDSAIKMSEDISRLAIKKLRAIRERILTVRRAIAKPDVAQQGDVKVGKDAQKLLDEALQEQARWEHYETDRELYQQLMEEAGYGKKEEVPAPAPAPAPVAPAPAQTTQQAPANPDNPLGLDGFDDMLSLFSESEEDKRRAAQEKAKAGVSKPEKKAWGSENKVVSTEQYEAAKKRMLERMKRLNVGFDPGILSDGAIMASYHIEAGARKFTDFAKRMMDDLGEGIKPYLKSIYESARRMPGMEDVAKDMDSTQSVDDFSFDDPKEETKDLASSLREIIDMQVSAGAKQQRLMRLASQFNISEKEIQERCEAEVVAMAREINAENISDEEKYRKMVELYDRQPNFSKRTSTSIANQAYSTPVPLAWLVGKRIGLAGKSTYEPTAGTGMLTIAGTPEFTTVNEIDDLRRDILSKQGFQSVTNNDAVKGHPKMIFDRIVMNPPFGRADPKTYGGYKLSKIDHIIAAEALSALNSKGRAAIIIGANTEGYDGDGRASFADHVFMSYLYDNFNVKDNYIISGDLYRKQGASYPVRVLTLSGRRSKTAEIIDHPTDIEVIKNWDTLYQRMKGDVENGQLSETGGSNSMDGAGQRADQQGQNAGNGGRRSGGDGETLGADSVAPGENTGRPEILGAGNEQQLRGRRGFGANQPKKPIVPGSTESDGGIGTGLGTRTEPLPLSSEHGTDTTDNQADTGKPGNERSGLSVPDGRKLDGSPASTEGGLVGEERGELNNAYIAGSQSTDKMDVVIPRYMAKAVSDSLANLKNKVGDIDAFVQQELGYESKEDLYDALADVQIDGVALAIDAIRNHNGFVLGDQTGIGKGRQCAAIIRWAQKHDVMPVFITADQNLFTDMYRDGNDIGSVFKPLIMASDSAKAQIADANGNVIVSLPRNQESAFQSMLGDNSEYDVVFTSYSQLAKSSGRQQNFLRALASDRRCLFVMDEAHKASGESNVGMFFAADDGILNSPNVDVLYASATFAKRPDNMSLYFRTNINKAVENQSSLTGVLARGGVPLQQILSIGLAQDGQYVRRERDFTGVNIEMRIAEPVDEKTGQIDKTALADLVTTYDRVAGVLEALVAHSELVKNVVTNAVRAQYGQANTREKTSVGMSTFASVVHNFVAQLLLASKCNICVQQAAMAFKEGKKPVIALTNTLESNLKEYIESEGISVGDPLSMKYSHILENAVYRMYRYTEKDRTGQAIRHEFAPEDFGLGEAHERMIRAIHDLDDIDLPISPIDYMKDQLERRGIRTGEITGRGYTVDYSGEIPVLSRRESEAKDKNKIVNDFNSGKMDAVILNASGSTGLSIHAAAWFADKRPRHMILVQPSLDIAIVIQTLGRIMRTGQVVKPSYVFLPSPLNAERRPFAVLAKKMQSLNANTTANNKSNISFDEDFINKYGDMVAQQFLNENAEIASRIGLDADTTDGDTPESNIMTRLTGRMALLDNATQGEIYDDLLARYTSLIELQKAIGEYDLEISVHDDWDVISGEETELASGDANGSIFTRPVKMKRISLSEKYSVRSAKEIREKIKENLGETRGEVVNRINNDLAHVEKAIENLEGAYKPGTKTKEFINDRKRFSREAFSHFTEFIINNAGEVLELTIGEENFSAAITGYRIVGKANPRSPFIPSRVMIDFAIAGKLGKLTIPFSRFRTQEVTYSRSMYDIDYYFTGKKVDTRSNRYAITGNIMRGLEYAEAGKVVSYKTNDGKVESALLLPKAWNPSKLVRDPQNEIHGVDEAIDFLKNNDQGIKTADGLLRIYKYYDYFVLESPMTGRNRGKYAQDRDGLLKITGDFISRNRKMRTESLDEKTTRRAIGYLLNRKDVILAKEREANDTSLLPNNDAEPIDRKYSLSQHRQVNPIMLDGEVRDEYRSWLENGRYTPEQVAEWHDKALRWIVRQGGVLKAANEFADGTAPAGKIGTMAARLIMNSQEFAGFDEVLRKAVADQYIFQGTEWGREGVARRLASLNLDTIEKAQVFFDRLTAKMEKDDRDRLRDDVEDRTGVDIFSLPPDIVNDPAKLDEVLRAALTSSATMQSKVREYWINAILSGPQTHAANMVGNFANMMYELGPKRLAEAMINLAARRKDGATVGEFKAMVSAFDWRSAWQRAKAAFDQEVLSPNGKVENTGVAIKGKHGRIIRLPGRLLKAADEFAKAIIAPVEAAAYAYREAMSKGFSESDAKDYIQRQLANKDSEANQFGATRAIELTFQEDPGAAVQHLVALREKGGIVGTFLQYFLPFIKTPANLLRQGVRKSPLGVANLAGETFKLLRGKRQLDNDYVALVAEQLLAWGAVAMFLGMGDDDDDRPILTGTGAGMSLNERRFKGGVVPSYSIRIGDKYYNYRRLEPLSTGLTLIADGMAAYRDAKHGKAATAAIKDMMHGATMLITEKSYLNSLDQIHQFITDPERGIEQWGTSFLASWIPNVIRQTVNTMDSNLRDYRSRARGNDWWKEQFFHTAGKAGLVRVAPMVDYFGREVKKYDAENSSPGADLWRLVSPIAVKPSPDMEKADLLLWNYNQANPDTAFWPGLPSYTFQRNRERFYFSGEDYADFAAESGKLAHKQINNAIRRGLLNVNKPTDKDIDLIKRIFTRARRETRDKFFAKKRYDRASSE